jgi:SAM-dependent methyltransferase
VTPGPLAANRRRGARARGLARPAPHAGRLGSPRLVAWADRPANRVVWARLAAAGCLGLAAAGNVGWVRGVSFDRAAGFYDATRGLPDATRDILADTLAAELAGRGRCLEIGVGTGRIALPLHERGVALAGADIAPEMLKRLVANAGGQPPFPIMIADATALPLATASFGAVLASHVLHLIPEWRAAVDEAVRLLRPGGVLLADFGGGAPAPWNRPCHELLNRRGIFLVRPGVSDPDAVAAQLGEQVPVRPLAPLTMTFRQTLNQDLDEWERQMHAWTWPYTPEQLRAACADIRAWAADDNWPLDQEFELERTIQWWVFERPTITARGSPG